MAALAVARTFEELAASGCSGSLISRRPDYPEMSATVPFLTFHNLGYYGQTHHDFHIIQG